MPYHMLTSRRILIFGVVESDTKVAYTYVQIAFHLQSRSSQGALMAIGTPLPFVSSFFLAFFVYDFRHSTHIHIPIASPHGLFCRFAPLQALLQPPVICFLASLLQLRIHHPLENLPCKSHKVMPA